MSERNPTAPPICLVVDHPGETADQLLTERQPDSVGPETSRVAKRSGIYEMDEVAVARPFLELDVRQP